MPNQIKFIAMKPWSAIKFEYLWLLVSWGWRVDKWYWNYIFPHQHVGNQDKWENAVFFYPPHPLQSRLFLMKIKYGGKLFYEWNLFIEHLLKFKISTFTLCFSKKDIWEKSKVNYISILMKPSSAINID